MMPRRRSKAVVFRNPVGTGGVVLAQHRGRKGEAAPENWSKIDAKYAVCASGKNQSPIDLKGFVEADLKALKLDYTAGVVDST